MTLNPTALALFLLAGLVIFLAVTGRLDAVWTALQGGGRGGTSGSVPSSTSHGGPGSASGRAPTAPHP